MSEIEKMFKNTGCLIVTACHIEYKDGSTCNCLYPTFTEHKQLELIKWLCKEKYFIGRYTDSYDLFTNSMLGYNSKNKNFEIALAGLVNNLWQYLTEEDKEEIRGILKNGI